MVSLERARRGVAVVDRRSRLLIAALAVVELAVVLEVDRRGVARPFGTAALIASLVLSPLAVAVAARLARRVAGPRFAVAAAVIYVLQPFVARAYSYGPFVAVHDHTIIPAALGLRHTWLLGVGVGVGLVLGVAPRWLAGPAGVVAAAIACVLWLGGGWTDLFDNLHESAWSPTLLAFLPVAAVIAVARRTPLLAAALGGWLAVAILRGLHRPYESGGFWLSLVAAAPAIAALLSALPLLVPRLRLPAAARAPRPDAR